MLAITNGKLILKDKIIKNGVLLIKDKFITYAGKPKKIPEDYKIIDAKGQYISPGFFDIHCHGGGGFKSYDNPAKMAKAHLLNGTTSIFPTIAYNVPMDRIKQGVLKISKSIKNDMSNIEGIHMEGPYINKKFGAASNTAVDINPGDYKEIIKRGKGNIKLWTLAPELKDIDPLIDLLYEKNIVISAGHTEAYAEKVAEYIDKGLKNMCHLSNAMTFLPINETGCTTMGAGAAAFLYDELYAEVIPDLNGVHVKPNLLKLIYKIKGSKTIIITDGTSCSALEKHKMSEDYNIIDDLRYVKGELSGSCLTMANAVNNFLKHTGCDITKAVECASLNPARLMGISDKIGSLESGKIANVLIFDENIQIKRVILKGKSVK